MSNKDNGESSEEEVSPTEELEVEQKEQPSLWRDITFTFPRPRVKFGPDMVDYIPNAIHELLNPLNPHLKKSDLQKPKALLVTGGSSLKNSGKLDEIIENCLKNNIQVEVYSAGSKEPTVEIVDAGVDFAKDVNPQFIVGIGGGGPLDVAKTLAGIYANGGNMQEYHAGKEFSIPGLPFIAVPTTAGTGSEITNNAVIIDRERGYKKSIRGSNLIAKYILLDPNLTITCPPEITANSGADAFVQAVEPYVSKYSHPLSDIYALQAIVLLGNNLHEAVHNGTNYDARAQMLLGSYFAGIAFSNVKLGLVHGLAHPIGYKYELPHGKVCACLLPWVIEYNLEVRAEKYAQIAQKLSVNDFFHKYEAEASDEDNTRRLIGMIKELFTDVGLPIRLGDLGVEKSDFDWIIENTKGGSFEANPRTPDDESLKEFLENAL